MQETAPKPAPEADSEPDGGEAGAETAVVHSEAGATDSEAEPEPTPPKAPKTPGKKTSGKKTPGKKTPKRSPAKPARGDAPAAKHAKEPAPGAGEPQPTRLVRKKRNTAKAYVLPDELSARPPGMGTLRVVSANLRNGQVDPEAFAELVAAMRADIVAIQEAGRAHFDALAPELPHGEFENAPANSGLGIAVRRPATPGCIEIAWRGARLMSLDPADWPELQRPLEIVNVHIAPPHFYKPPLYGFVLRNQQVRALESHFGSPAHDPEAPEPRGSVLIGDFNATPLWPVYRRIASQFTDAAIAVAQVSGRAAEPTWSLPEDTPRRLRIDHAFVRGVTPQEFQAVRIAGSDHSVIVVDILDRTNRSSC